MIKDNLRFGGLNIWKDGNTSSTEFRGNIGFSLGHVKSHSRNYGEVVEYMSMEFFFQG